MKQCKVLNSIDLKQYNIKSFKTNYNQINYIYNNKRYNFGRIKEDIIRINYNNESNMKENTSHKIGEDAIINRKKVNIKAINCEMKSNGNTLEEMIDNYIEIDYCKYLLFALEIDNILIPIIMKWSFAKTFILKFGNKEHDKIRIKDNKNKTRQQIMLQWIIDNM